MPGTPAADAFFTVPSMVVIQTTVTVFEVACNELWEMVSMTAVYARDVGVALVTVVVHVVPLPQPATTVAPYRMKM
jgi:hypothetical protein